MPINLISRLKTIFLNIIIATLNIIQFMCLLVFPLCWIPTWMENMVRYYYLKALTRAKKRRQLYFLIKKIRYLWLYILNFCRRSIKKVTGPFNIPLHLETELKVLFVLLKHLLLLKRNGNGIKYFMGWNHATCVVMGLNWREDVMDERCEGGGCL